MAMFIKLEDSPMFQKQVGSLEQTADELRDRCQKLYKGCKKYTEVLGEACSGDVAFAAALEAFGGGLDDLLGVSIGGPVLSRFINALRELATYKEFLRSQVEHVLVDRLSQFLSVDLQDAKESRRRFDKAIYSYDQAREKFSSLKKNTKDEVVAEFEEDLQNSKSAFERSRFNLVHILVNIEAKKKFEFLESFSAIMDAHLRYFKLGYDLLNQMEPYIHQVLTYAQQSKEQALVEQDKLAKRIQEFRTQSELAQLQASANLAASSNVIGMNGFSTGAYKSMEVIMQSAAKGEDLQAKGMIGRGHELRGLYYITLFSPPTSAPIVCQVTVSPLQIHCRLGHPSLEKLKICLPTSSHVKSIECGACQLGKHHQVLYPPLRENKRSPCPFSLVHSNVLVGSKLCCNILGVVDWRESLGRYFEVLWNTFLGNL